MDFRTCGDFPRQAQREPGMTTATTEHDHMTEVIARAIGPNSEYPSPVQLAAHRAKQALKEKQFPTIESKEVTE